MHLKFQLLNSIQELKDAIYNLLDSQVYGVLVTNGDFLHTSLMAFCITPDMKKVVFSTTKTTLKYENIKNDRKVSFFVSNATNDIDCVRSAQALTVIGNCSVVSDDLVDELKKLYLDKNDFMSGFSSYVNAEFLCIDVETFRLVTDFKNTWEYNPS